jgi:hypothetical protein
MGTEDNGEFLGAGGPLLGGVTQWLGGFSSPASFSPSLAPKCRSSIFDTFDQLIGFNEEEMSGVATVAAARKECSSLSSPAAPSSHTLAQKSSLPMTPVSSLPPPPSPPSSYSPVSPAPVTMLSAFDQLIINALEEDADYDSDLDDGTSINDSFSLSFDDASVQLNAMALTPLALCGLLETYSVAAAATMTSTSSRSSPIDITVQELTRCQTEYNRVLDESVELFVGHFYITPVSVPLRECLEKRSYEISGEAMEKRVGNNEFVRMVQDTLRCFGQKRKTSSFNALSALAITSSDATTSHYSSSSSLIEGVEGGGGGGGGGGFEILRRHLGVVAYCRVVSLIASHLNTLLVSWILETQFTEWGALLLHEELLTLIRIFDVACEDSSANVLFEKALWAVKIITIDQPADIMRYHVPSSFFNESDVRSLMSRRTDLSKDAVAKVKLNLV